METNEEIIEEKEDRKISVLLSLDTFQGMTDSEIQSIIDFKVDLAHKDEQSRIYAVEAQETLELLDETCANMVESSQKVLDTILNSTLQVVTPELETVELETE